MTEPPQRLQRRRAVGPETRVEIVPAFVTKFVVAQTVPVAIPVRATIRVPARGVEFFGDFGDAGDHQNERRRRVARDVHEKRFQRGGVSRVQPLDRFHQVDEVGRDCVCAQLAQSVQNPCHYFDVDVADVFAVFRLRDVALPSL